MPEAVPVLPSSLGTLQLLGEIGRGGFGTVYSARMEGISRPLAIKVFDPSSFQNDIGVALRRFHLEGEYLQKLRHPHIIQVLGMGLIGDKPFLLMEYFDGFNLYSVRDKFGEPSPQSVLKFIERIASAVSYAHEQGIVHRDIKPTNLMTKAGDARLLDFGIAVKIDPKGERLTKVGGTIVGDSFCAPELHDNPRLVDPRTDIYSLGACWYWLLTGVTPKGVDWDKKIREVKGIKPDYERIVFHCLQDIDHRYQTASELARDLQILRQGNPVPTRKDEIDDRAALFLGATLSITVSVPWGASLYSIEQQIGNKLKSFAMAIVIQKLKRFELIEEIQGEDHDGEKFRAFRLSEKGHNFAEENSVRIEKLLDEAKPEPVSEKPTTVTEDVPF